MPHEDHRLPVSKPCISADDFHQIVRGDIITYLLAANQLPTDPLREWHGRVEHVHPHAVTVTVLDAGYDGEREIVGREEILSVITARARSNDQEGMRCT